MHFAANLSLLFPDDVSFAERCARVAAQGFNHVEMLFPYDLHPQEYLLPLQDHGLQPLLINTPIADDHFGLAALPNSKDRFKADFDRALHTAQSLGVPAIHVMAGITQHLDAQHWQETLQENLRYALAQAEGTGITLQLEALNRRDLPGYAYWNPADVLAIVRQMNSPQLQLQFDFYHCLVEGLPLLETLQSCRDVVSHVQIADPTKRHEPNLQQYPEMLQALLYLVNTQYHGSIGCEYKPAAKFEQGLKFLVILQQAGLCTAPEHTSCI